MTGKVYDKQLIFHHHKIKQCIMHDFQQYVSTKYTYN